MYAAARASDAAAVVPVRGENGDVLQNGVHETRRGESSGKQDPLVHVQHARVRPTPRRSHRVRRWRLLVHTVDWPTLPADLPASVVPLRRPAHHPGNGEPVVRHTSLRLPAKPRRHCEDRAAERLLQSEHAVPEGNRLPHGRRIPIRERRHVQTGGRGAGQVRVRRLQTGRRWRHERASRLFVRIAETDAVVVVQISVAAGSCSSQPRADRGESAAHLLRANRREYHAVHAQSDAAQPDGSKDKEHTVRASSDPEARWQGRQNERCIRWGTSGNDR